MKKEDRKIKLQGEIESKLQKLEERSDSILRTNQVYLENKEEFLILFSKFLLLQKKILAQKGGKLLEKDEMLKKSLINIDEIKKIISEDEIENFLILA